MKTHPKPAVSAFAAACAIFALATPASAGTMSASATAPVVNGLDIANYAATNGTNKWFVENTADGSAKGQTFTTGSIPVMLKSISYRSSTNSPDGQKTYVVRVGTLSGTTFSQIHSETMIQNFAWYAEHYMTWAFSGPVLLAPNTTYAIDVGMTASTVGWNNNLVYLYRTANTYAGGGSYTSGTSGVGTNTVAFVANTDRTFHLDLQHPLAPSPDIGTSVPAGDVTLSWTNLQTTPPGGDVWVDVWFGTDSGNLTKVVDGGLNITSTIVNAPTADTYHWRVDSYLDGDPEGTPVQSPVFNFIVFDSDGDGFPDAYELLHTTPPSATALNINDDLEPDGLTNWQEFQLGTSPTNPDTDGDTLNDGSELTGVGSRPPTVPTKADTDGDGLNDGVESNTGTWVNASNTGTNPAKTDTDSDALSDGVETNTGTNVSKTNTGTHPLVSDTDADGAGDWYEVTASFTSPFLATEKPDVPYPLPDPDASTGATNKPVRIYIMSGQSNMLGYGTRDGTDDKSLETMTLRQNKFPDLINGTGAWTTRQDVHYRGVISDTGKVKLSPANLGSTFGPELGFGYVMGWHHDEPVLLLKTSIGNRSLGWDVYPAGSPSYQYGGNVYAAYGQSPLKWSTGGGPAPFAWYSGKQYDDYFLHESDMGPLMTWMSGTIYPDGTQLRHNGVLYSSKDRKNPDGTDIPNHTASPNSEPGIGTDWQTYWQVHSIFNAVDVLDNFASEYPGWAAQGFKIAGFVWWQGDKDRYDLGHATRYEQNLVNLINSLRNYYTNRYPGKVVNNAPFVLATLGQTPLTSTDPAEKPILDGMLAVDGESGKYSQFAGNVKTVYAHPLSEGGASNSHYNLRAGTYMLVGDALGRAMVELESITPPGITFANWIAGYPAVPPGLAGFDQDADGDGIDNGAENFFGTNPGIGSSGMVAGASSGNTFVFTHPQNATPATGVTAVYRWSKDLTTFRNGGQTDGDNTTVNFNAVTNTGITTVTATVTGTPAAKLFVDVKVTQN